MRFGYPLFAEDVKHAFQNRIRVGDLKVKSEEWFKNVFCHRIVLEGDTQVLEFYIDDFNLHVDIVDKRTSICVSLDEIFRLFYDGIDIREIKKQYFFHDYYENAVKSNSTSDEKLAVISDHYYLGELNAYSMILEKYLLGKLFNFNK